MSSGACTSSRLNQIRTDLKVDGSPFSLPWAKDCKSSALSICDPQGTGAAYTTSVAQWSAATSVVELPISVNLCLDALHHRSTVR